MANHRGKRQARRITKARTTQDQLLSSPSLWLMVGLFAGILGAVLVYVLLTGQWSLKTLNPNTQTKAEVKRSKPTTIVSNEKKETVQRFEFYQILPGMEVPIPDAQAETIASTKQPQLLPPSTTKEPSVPKEPSTPVVPLPQTPSVPITKASPLPQVANNTIKSELSKDTKKIKPVLKKSALEKPKLPPIERKVAAARYLIQIATFRQSTPAVELQKRLNSQGIAAMTQKISTKDGFWFRVAVGPFPSETVALNQKKRLDNHKIHGTLLLQR